MRKKPVPRQFSLEVHRHAEIDGIDMGVMSDGTPFLTARGLAALCGLAPSTLSTWANKWSPAASGGVDRAITDLLQAQGYFEDQLYFPITENGTTYHAFPEIVCMAVLEYYAFDAKGTRRPEAERNYRVLARAGLRTFIYAKVGYDPRAAIPDPWKAFHARQVLNAAPTSHFSVFKETAELIVTAIRNGLVVDAHTVPDASVGIAWSKYWIDIDGELRYGPRIKHPHVYPDDFPQSKADIEAWAYPLDALGEFRRWLHSTYIPGRFPQYLADKVKKRALPASSAALILRAMGVPVLGAGDDD